MEIDLSKYIPAVIAITVTLILECLFFMGYNSTVDKEKLINNAVEATNYAQLDQAIKRGDNAVLVYGEVNVDKMNNESCVKPEGASKYTPCYIAMSSTDEVYQSHEESYDCSRNDEPRTCYRTVWSWDDVDYSYNRPRTVEINEVSLPYSLVIGAESSLSVREMRLDRLDNWDSGHWNRGSSDWYVYKGSNYRRRYRGLYNGTSGAMVLDFSKNKNNPDAIVDFTQVSSIDAARKIGSQKEWKMFWIVLMTIAGIIGIAVAIYYFILPVEISR